MKPSTETTEVRNEAPLLAARGIVAFADVDWDGTWYSRHQILSRLAGVCPVVVFEWPPDARDVLAGRAQSHPALRSIAPNLWSYRAPRHLPLAYRPRALASLLGSLQDRHFAASLRRLGLRDPIHYVFHPSYAELIARLPKRFTIYHTYDKYAAYEGASTDDVDEMERDVVHRSQLAFASSRVLAADLEQRSGHAVRHLPHAVEFEFFAGRAANDEVPSELASLPRPRIGYIARLDERTDDEALRQIAIARPGWSIVIVGGAGFTSQADAERFRALSELPNVHTVGNKPRESIPSYCAGLDVCLLAYRTDNWGKWVQPIKAYEYLACGKPVVSAPIDAARDFGELVRIVEGADGWVSAIEAVLEAETPEIAARRVEYARTNTWERRVAELVSFIEEGLEDQVRS
jgi:glycosyltransferase involved in cell wall biosynthesis